MLTFDFFLIFLCRIGPAKSIPTTLNALFPSVIQLEFDQYCLKKLAPTAFTSHPSASVLSSEIQYLSHLRYCRATGWHEFSWLTIFCKLVVSLTSKLGALLVPFHRIQGSFHGSLEDWQSPVVVEKFVCPHVGRVWSTTFSFLACLKRSKAHDISHFPWTWTNRLCVKFKLM